MDHVTELWCRLEHCSSGRWLTARLAKKPRGRSGHTAYITNDINTQSRLDPCSQPHGLAAAVKPATTPTHAGNGPGFWTLARIISEGSSLRQGEASGCHHLSRYRIKLLNELPPVVADTHVNDPPRFRGYLLSSGLKATPGGLRPSRTSRAALSNMRCAAIMRPSVIV